jgi:filamentous hemagglutinin
MRNNGYDSTYPIDAANIEGQLVIIDGHHRALAATKARIQTVPVVIHDTDPVTAKKLEDDMYNSRCP